jgi:hypothetical protein
MISKRKRAVLGRGRKSTCGVADGVRVMCDALAYLQGIV